MTQQPRKKRPRRNLKSTLVEPFKQVKIGLYVMAISVTFVIAAAFLFFEAFSEQYEHVMNIFNVVDPSTKWELVVNDVFYYNAIKLGLLFVVYIAVLFTIIFKATHRIYGPLVNIERFVSDLSAGNYHKRVVIRRGDELQRLADRLNRLAEKLEEERDKKAS